MKKQKKNLYFIVETMTFVMNDCPFYFWLAIFFDSNNHSFIIHHVVVMAHSLYIQCSKNLLLGDPIHPSAVQAKDAFSFLVFVFVTNGMTWTRSLGFHVVHVVHHPHIFTSFRSQHSIP